MTKRITVLGAKYRYSIILLKQLVKTDFKLRYQNSILGYLWSLLRPLAIFAILYVIFVRFLDVGRAVPHYPVYLLTGIVLWNYFAEVTVGSVTSIVGKSDILRKINFPKYVIVLAGSFSALINLLLNFIIIAIFMALNHVSLHMSALLVPLLVFELFVFALAVAFFLSSVYVKFRDMAYIWEVFMQGAFYATPILYPLSLHPVKGQIPVKAAKILILNPVAQIIQEVRHALVTDKAVTINQLYGKQWAFTIPIAVTLLVVYVAARYFRNSSRFFAEDV